MDNKERIVTALNSPDEEIRLQGLRSLAELDSTQRLDLVFQALGDSSWRLRKEAIDIFMSLPVCKDLIGEVIKLLHAEDNAGLRNAAVEILSRMGRDAVPMLLDQANCPDHDVRKFILDILGDIATPAAIPVMICGLEDTDSNVRAAAAENLGKLKAEAAVPALLAAMRHPDLLLQFTILDTLSRISAPVTFNKLLPYKDEKLLRKALIDCLGKAGDASAVAELVASLVDDMRNVREAALLALVEISRRYPEEVKLQLSLCDIGPSSAVVSGYLNEEYNDTLKLAAIRVLGWLGAEDSVMALLQMLDYESLQKEAMLALVDIGVANPDALLNAWGLVDGNRRAYLAYILGEAGCVGGLTCLQQGLVDSDQQLQRMSAYALGQLGEASILLDLVRCLQSSSSDVQEATTQALITLGRKFPDETFSALQPLLAHSESKQRMFAVMVLREIDNSKVLDVLSRSIKDPAAEVRRAAIRVYEGCDLTDHIGTLLLSLTDEDAEVRRAAVDILGNCKDEQALDGLQLALQDEDIWVRSAAVRGIGCIGGNRSKSLIEQALADPVGLVSIAALETLGDLFGDEACEAMVAALNHPDEEVVTAAMNLLSRYGSSDWLKANVKALMIHPFWVVRAHIARLAAEILGVSARPLLVERLGIEETELVRQQLTALLDELPEN